MDGKLDEETQQRINDGDWLCVDSQCGNINFARRNSCNRCGKDRGECSKKKKMGQEIGKVAAEKSRGLFSADDWQCSKCGNVNWARRQQCNMCNAPKFGEVEERTGYGGGYNDRGIVEYKERRNDDDDDYDEFGRRKKKRKLDRSDDESRDSKRYSQSPSRSKSKNSHNKLTSRENLDVHILIQNNYQDNKFKNKNKQRKKNRDVDEDNNDNAHLHDDDDDKDDDDDEEGDLSKYDLSEWDDFVPKAQSTHKHYADSSNSRRSRNGDKWRDSGTSRQ